MNTDLKKAADQRFEEALAKAGARDPRDYYRGQLRELKGADPDGYANAVGYYTDTLLPSIAEGKAEPLAAWREYGLLIARLIAPGKTVAVDTRGLARPYEPPGDSGDMVLHLAGGPGARGGRVLLVGLPPQPSAAQTATYDWLVAGRRALRGA